MIWLLLILLIALCVLAVWLFKKDFFAPGFIVCLVYLISTVFCIYNYDRWELWNYHLNTVLIIVSSLLVFVFTSFFVNRYFEKKKPRLIAKNKDKLSLGAKESKIIQTNVWVRVLLVVLFVGMIALSIYEVYRIASLTSFNGSFFSCLENFRKMTSYSLKFKTTLAFRVLQKIINGTVYVLIYIVVRNLFNKDKIKNNWVYMFCIFLFIVQSFTISARAPILRIAAAALFLIFVFANRRIRWKRNLFSRFLRFGAICFAVLLIGFFATKGLTGRGKNYDPMNYLSIYAGGSIELLDLYVNKPVQKKDDSFGKETFYGLNSVLSRISGNEIKYTKHLEYRKVGKNLVGNVYTPLRRYIADFGLFGCYVLVAFVSAFFSWMYCKIINIARENNYRRDWLMVLYSLLVYVLFLYSIDDQLFTTIISFNYVAIATVAFISYFILVEPMKTKLFAFEMKRRLQRR